jgi:hypothetical protein
LLAITGADGIAGVSAAVIIVPAVASWGEVVSNITVDINKTLILVAMALNSFIH